MGNETYNFADLSELQRYLETKLLTKEQAAKITEQSAAGFSQSVKLGNIKPFYESDGKGPGKVRLYWKDDLERYRVSKRQVNKKKS